MLALSHKSKQYGSIALKVLLLSITFWYIYSKLTSNEGIHLGEFMAIVQSKPKVPIILFLLLASLNWTFEILKWQTAVSSLQKCSFKEATKQSLAALTVSLATPNRIGEYGAKAYFFEVSQRKKILLLQFFSSLFQMTTTCLFGFIGLLIVANTYPIRVASLKIFIGFLLFVGIGVLGYYYKEREFFVKGLSIANVIAYFKNFATHLKVRLFIFSILRYVIFSSLFYLLLTYFDAQINWKTAFPLITSMYLLSSIIPTIFIFDVVVKSGVALWLFSLAAVPLWSTLCTVFSMWLLNFMIPAIWGSYYVVSYQKV